MKNRFKVKAGLHIEDGVTYKKDDIVTSEKPLGEMFKGKFESLGPVKEVVEEELEQDEPEPPKTPQPSLSKAVKAKVATKAKRKAENWDD